MDQHGPDIPEQSGIKPHHGRITDWREERCSDGLGYFIRGRIWDNPNVPAGKITHTSYVVKHDEKTGEIETRNSRYVLAAMLDPNFPPRGLGASSCTGKEGDAMWAASGGRAGSGSPCGSVNDPSFQFRKLTPEQEKMWREAAERNKHGVFIVERDRDPSGRKYLPTFADLIDRLTIINQKLIFIPERQQEYLLERADILHDLDLLISSPHFFLTAKAVLAITMIQLTNRYIWENEAHVRNGATDQDGRLMLTHSINGVRNSAKNMLAEEVGGRKDYKIDALAEELPTEYGNWKRVLEI